MGVTEALGRASTRLVLPVPELARQVPHAQVVLLDPFLELGRVDEGVLGELEDLFADVVPFAFELGEAARFPGGAAYLPPRPAAAFRGIVHALRRAFPEAGEPAVAIDGAIPHLPVPDGGSDDGGAGEVTGAVTLPVEAHAREAVLLDPDGVVLATFPFGTSAA